MSGHSAVVRMDSANEALKQRFLHWQCKLRQIVMREQRGRPDDGIRPLVLRGDETQGERRIVTVLCRLPEHSQTMELKHMVRRTQDPLARLDAAVRFFGERYYQEPEQFCDRPTASFAADSALAGALVAEGRCRLVFERFNQGFELDCAVRRLSPNNPLHEATRWHNLLFNPNPPPDPVILGFEPDWGRSEEWSGKRFD